MSVKWATCNVGATKPEEYGLYFAWGETEGYTGITDTKNFSWDDYQFSIFGSSTAFSKYSTDNLTTLELTDDAARVNMGGNWRMPTKTEYNELLSNTTTAWTTVNGVSGMKFTSKSDTSKSIFVPASGYCRDGSVKNTGSYGRLWSSSLRGSNATYAHELFFNSSGISPSEDCRNFGFSVRGVLA